MIPDDAISNARRHMRRGEVLFRIKTTAMFVFGIPLSFVGPLLLSSMFWLAAFMFGYHGVRWAWFFRGAVVVVIPLLYRLELRTRGDYLGTVATGPGSAAPPGAMMAPAAFGTFGSILGIAVVPCRRPEHAGGA